MGEGQVIAFPSVLYSHTPSLIDAPHSFCAPAPRLGHPMCSATKIFKEVPSFLCHIAPERGCIPDVLGWEAWAFCEWGLCGFVVRQSDGCS